jgi:predicted membrane protein
MRWNVVIGGQTFSKSLRGFRENEIPGLFEKEGIALAVLVLVLPLLFIVLFNRVLPVFERPGEKIPEGAQPELR